VDNVLDFSGGNLVLGRWDSTSYFLNGAISEVRIASIVYTANQIALFHDRPWDIYRPVSRPVYFLPGEAPPSLSIPVARRRGR